MNIRLGDFTIMPAMDRLDLLAEPVAGEMRSLPNSNEVGVVEIDPGVSDTRAFCERHQIGPEVCANCVIIEVKKGEVKQLAACVVLATTRIDVNGVVRQVLDAKKASFAPMEKAVLASQMEFGAITPIGLPLDWPILVDAAVTLTPYVIIGSGLRKSKLVVPGKLLSTLPNVQLVEGLGRIPTI